MAETPYSYTPYTSEMLDAGNALVTDLNPFTALDEITPTLPNGKQVIFFSIGIVCVIASLALITRSLIDVSEVATTIAKIAA